MSKYTFRKILTLVSLAGARPCSLFLSFRRFITYSSDQRDPRHTRCLILHPRKKCMCKSARRKRAHDVEKEQRAGEVIQARVSRLSERACRPANTGNRQSIPRFGSWLSLHA